MPGHIPLIRVTAMPPDTNPYGGVFGARLMKWFKAFVENPLAMVA